MGRPLKIINEIVKGVTAITAETALQLEKVTGVPASFWNNAESNYRERLARLKEREAIKEQTDWLFHEAAHILLHGKKDVFIEFRGKSSRKEKEADVWAADFLISKSDWKAFLANVPQPTQADVQRFAQEQNVAAGIVPGRLQHQEKRIGAGSLNHLKHRLEINWSGLTA